jgi:hypothetical protein
MSIAPLKVPKRKQNGSVLRWLRAVAPHLATQLLLAALAWFILNGLFCALFSIIYPAQPPQFPMSQAVRALILLISTWVFNLALVGFLWFKRPRWAAGMTLAYAINVGVLAGLHGIARFGGLFVGGTIPFFIEGIFTA